MIVVTTNTGQTFTFDKVHDISSGKLGSFSTLIVVSVRRGTDDNHPDHAVKGVFPISSILSVEEIDE